MRHHSGVDRVATREARGPASCWPLLLALALCATPAAAQPVVKCLDADGNVTYQNAPCEKGQAARPMELPKAESRDDTSAWTAAAQDGQVLRGMPKRWVLRARGAPAEIRRGAAREGANEVWRYAGKDGAQMLVGFQGEEVAWVRDDARDTRTGTPAASAGGAASMPPPVDTSVAAAGESTRGPQNRRFVIAGRYCEHVFAEIGVADREEALAVAAGSRTAGKRYYYEPAPGDPSMRTVFSCLDGRVADVERTLVR